MQEAFIVQKLDMKESRIWNRVYYLHPPFNRYRQVRMANFIDAFSV